MVGYIYRRGGYSNNNSICNNSNKEIVMKVFNNVWVWFTVFIIITAAFTGYMIAMALEAWALADLPQPVQYTEQVQQTAKPQITERVQYTEQVQATARVQ
jgi:hypothetical protein